MKLSRRALQDLYPAELAQLYTALMDWQRNALRPSHLLDWQRTARRPDHSANGPMVTPPGQLLSQIQRQLAGDDDLLVLLDALCLRPNDVAG